jgi:hypothetical protein
MIVVVELLPLRCIISLSVKIRVVFCLTQGCRGLDFIHIIGRVHDVCLLLSTCFCLYSTVYRIFPPLSVMDSSNLALLLSLSTLLCSLLLMTQIKYCLEYATILLLAEIHDESTK